MDLLQPQGRPKGIPPGARASRPHDDGFPGARASRPHNDGFPGARASRPHQAWHSLDHLPHLNQTGTAPWLSFGLAAAVPADRVAACGIALKLSGSQRDSMRAGRPRSRARLFPPGRADHSRKNGRSFMKTNHQWTQIDTNRPEDRWTCFNHQGRPKGIPPGARASRPHDDGFPGARASRPHNDGFPGARASRPHQAWHSLGHLPHLDQPGTAPWLSFGLAAAVPAGRVAACGIADDRVAACGIALKLSGGTACGRDARAPRQGCSRRQGGCLRHCTEAQRQPKGQHAGGTPALPGKAKTGNMVYTFHQCINHSLRGSSWITLFSPSRPLADPYRSSSNPFVDIFFCLRHGLATSLPTEPAGCGASG